jgi:hypothetical protein
MPARVVCSGHRGEQRTSERRRLPLIPASAGILPLPNPQALIEAKAGVSASAETSGQRQLPPLCDFFTRTSAGMNG